MVFTTRTSARSAVGGSSDSGSVYQHYRIEQAGGRWRAVPAWLGRIDEADALNGANPAILWGSSRGELEAAINDQSGRQQVEYIGWLPIFDEFGDCGNHPQFAHLKHPPEGWAFVQTPPRLGISHGVMHAGSIDELTAIGAAIIEGQPPHPELVLGDFCGTRYNIIFYAERYFGVHSSDGAFDLRRAEIGDYACPVFRALTLSDITEMLVRKFGVSREHPDVISLAGRPDLARVYVSDWQQTGYDVVRSIDGEFSLRRRGSADGPTGITTYQSLDAALWELARLTGREGVFELTRKRPVVLVEGINRRRWNIIGFRGVYILASHDAAPAMSRLLVRGGNRVKRWLGTARAAGRLGVAAADILIRSLRYGGRLPAFVQFLRSRSPRSQLLYNSSADLAFIPSVPFFLGQTPWVIEIEDFISLCFPFIHNGRTVDVNIDQLPTFPILRSLLMSPQCRGVITHVKSTADSLPRAFRLPELARKVTYQPVGHALPELGVRTAPDDQVNVLFTSSWHQNEVGFFLRGGLDVLTAFRALAVRYPNVNLIFRSPLPPGLPTALLTGLSDDFPGRIVRIAKFLPGEQWRDMMANADIFALPAARIHVVSILEAMSYGLPVIVSDGWGIRDYVDDRRTGIVVKGRYGVVSWEDTQDGMLREDYRPMYEVNDGIVEQLVREIGQLIDAPDVRRGLGRAAREEVRDRFSIENWNRGLAAFLERARGGERS